MNTHMNIDFLTVVLKNFSHPPYLHISRKIEQIHR